MPSLLRAGRAILLNTLLGTLLSLGSLGVWAQSPSTQNGADGGVDSMAPNHVEATASPIPAQSNAALALQTRLQQVPGMEGVRVSEHSGVVRLEGSVLRADNRDIAELIAKQEAGVVAVQNRLQLSPSLSQRAKEAWQDGLARGQRFLLFLPLLLLAGLMVWGFSRAGRWLGHRPWLHLPGNNPYLSTLSRRLVQWSFFAIGVVVALDLLGATKVAGALLGSAGIMGVVIGFAFRDIVENYLAGILLTVRRPFAPREHVRIDSHEGRVVTLSSRTTVLMTLDGNELQLPNAMVFKAVILNLSRNPQRRLEFALTIDGKASISTALRLALEKIAQVSGVLAEPAPAGRVEQDSPNGTELRFTAWIDQSKNDLAKVRSECIRQVKNALTAGGIAAPSTTYTIITQKPKPSPSETPATMATAAQEEAQNSADTSVNAELDAQLDAQLGPQTDAPTGAPLDNTVKNPNADHTEAEPQNDKGAAA